jgi:hypothetical protein
LTHGCTKLDIYWVKQQAQGNRGTKKKEKKGLLFSHLVKKRSRLNGDFMAFSGQKPTTKQVVISKGLFYSHKTL